MAFRSHFLGVVAVTLLLALAGCGDDESSPPDLGPAPETSTSAASEPTATPTDAGPAFDDQGAEVHPGRIKADNAVEQDVADAWLAYWQVRLTAYHKAKVDAAALGEVAQDDALQEVVDYVGYLRDNGLHSEGDLQVGVSNVEVHGSVAAIQSCMVNKAMDVGESGEPAEELVPYANVIGSVSKVGSQWVVGVKEVTGDQRCRA